MTDVWVCSACKSINRQRDGRCYSCGRRKQDVAVVEAPDLGPDAPVAAQEVQVYSPSWPFALIAGALLAAVAVIGVYLVFEAFANRDVARALVVALQSGDRSAVDRVLGERLASPVSVVHFPLTMVAVLAFGAWLARACVNIPVLGGGTPTWTPLQALIYPLIPIVNLIRVPGMVEDALYRLDPGVEHGDVGPDHRQLRPRARAGSYFIVLAALAGLLGSWAVGLIAASLINAGADGQIGSARSRDDLVVAFSGALEQGFVLRVITELMTAIGALLLVIIIVRVESRTSARYEEIRAARMVDPAGTAAAMPPPGTTPEPVDIAYAAALPTEATPVVAPAGAEWPSAPSPVAETAVAPAAPVVASALPPSTHQPQRGVPVYRPQPLADMSTAPSGGRGSAPHPPPVPSPNATPAAMEPPLPPPPPPPGR